MFFIIIIIINFNYHYRTKRFPVLYIFGKQNIDIHDLHNHIITLSESNPNFKFILTYDVSYSHSVDSIKELFDESFPIVITRHINPQLEVNTDEYSFYFCGRYANLLKDTVIEDYIFIHIGEEGSYLTNLMMNYNSNTFYTYQPYSKEFRKEDIQVNRHLMRRFYLIERAKDSDIFGIVVGTLSVDKYLDILEKIKKMIKNAGKCFYTMIVGKLNVAKLANFPEIDMFVLISCPENSLIDSKEFYKPIITPFELQIALVEGKEWTNKYSTNFALLLNEKDDFEENKSNKEDTSDDEIRYSLVSGQLKRNHKRNIKLEIDDNNEPSDKNLVIRDKMELMTLDGPSASTFFLNRTYQGLKLNLGDAPMVAEEGKFGTARSYKPLEQVDNDDDIEEI